MPDAGLPWDELWLLLELEELELLGGDDEGMDGLEGIEGLDGIDGLEGIDGELALGDEGDGIDGELGMLTLGLGMVGDEGGGGDVLAHPCTTSAAAMPDAS